MRLRNLALALALATTTIACDETIPPGGYYVHIGDSTAVDVSERLSIGTWRAQGLARLELGTVPTYAFGRQLFYFTTRIQSATESGRTGTPDIALIQLGTNDLRTDADPINFQLIDTPEKIDFLLATLLNALPAETRVLWVMPGPGVPIERRDYLRAALERAPRPIHILTLPDRLYEDDVERIHFGPVLDLEAGLTIIGELDRLRLAQ